MSTNLVIVQGNVGQDPEVTADAAPAKFNIATDESYTNKDGEKVEATEWHRITCWGGLKTTVINHIRKGAKVCVTGKLKTETYTKDKFPGATFYSTDIIARNIDIIVWPKSDDDNESAEITDEDVPF